MTLLLYATQSHERRGSNQVFEGAIVTAIEVDAVVRAYNVFLRRNPYADEKWGGCSGATFPGPENPLEEITMDDGSHRFSKRMRDQHYEQLKQKFPSVTDLDPKAYYASLSARMGSEILGYKVRDLNDNELKIIDEMMKEINFYRIAMVNLDNS